MSARRRLEIPELTGVAGCRCRHVRLDDDANVKRRRRTRGP